MLNPRLARAFLLLILPTVLLAGVALLCMMWRIRTRVEVEATTARVVFTVGGTQHLPLLNPVSFKSITIREFSSIAFSPVRFGPPERSKRASGKEQSGSHARLREAHRVVIKGKEEEAQPSVTIESLSALQGAGGLGSFEVNPGSEVNLEASEAKRACLRIKNQEVALGISPPIPFLVSARHCVGDDPVGSGLNSLVQVAQLSDSEPDVWVQGNGLSLLLCVGLTQKADVSMLLADRIPITSVTLDEPNLANGDMVSAIRKAQISYPDFPKAEGVLIRRAEYLTLEQLEEFSIEDVSLNQNGDGLSVRLGGVAGSIKGGSQHFDKDRRLTAFDWVWQDSKTAGLFGVIVWVFATTVGARKLYMELKQ